MDILELKNTIQKQNSLGELNNRVTMTDDKSINLRIKQQDSPQLDIKGKIGRKKKQTKPGDLWHNNKRFNIHIIRIGEREWVRLRVCEDIMEEKSPNQYKTKTCKFKRLNKYKLRKTEIIHAKTHHN